MRFKIDENLPQDVSEVLRAQQHDAMTVVEQRLSGEPDSKIADICRNENRALITLDLDLADIRTYPPADWLGIVVIRPKIHEKISVLKMIDGFSRCSPGSRWKGGSGLSTNLQFACGVSRVMRRISNDG